MTTHRENPSSGRWPRVLLSALLVVALIFDAVLLREWRQTRGHEPVWIAQGLASGEGFSFDAGHRWLFPPPTKDAESRHPTAWIEPVYPLLLAACFLLSGEYARLAILALQVISVLATCVVIFRLAIRLQGAWAGVTAAGLLLLLPGTHLVATREIAAAALAGLLVSLCALLLVRAMEQPTLRRALTLGTAIGLATLTVAPALVAAPVAVVLLVTHRGRDRRRPRVAALAVLIATGVVLAPWVARNLAVFGEFVPVRTGGGVMLHMGNPALARLFTPSLRGGGEPPPPLASAADAVALTSQGLVEYLYANQLARMADDGPPGYAGFNEAQRDRVFGRRALRFMLAHPGITLELAFHRAVGYFLGFWKPAGALFLLALIGIVVSLRDRRALALWLLVLAFAVPYVLTMPLFYRYRHPVEPLVALLAACTLASGARLLLTRRRNARPQAEDVSELDRPSPARDRESGDRRRGAAEALEVERREDRHGGERELP